MLPGNNVIKAIVTIAVAIIAEAAAYAQNIGHVSPSDTSEKFYSGYAAENAMQVARDFGQKLQDWVNSSTTATKLKQKKSLEGLQGKKKILVKTRNAALIASSRGKRVQESYEWASYINHILLGIINPGGTRLTCSKYKVISPENIIRDDGVDRGILAVSFEMNFSGKFTDKEKCILLIRDGHITGMKHYEAEPGGKIRISMNDFDEYTNWIEAGYLYTPHFPVGLSLSFGQWCWTAGVEFGMNTDRRIYSDTEINATDPLNYTITRTQADPKYYIGVTGSLRMKYVGISCGYGLTQAKERVDTRDVSTSTNENGIVSSSGKSSSTSDAVSQYIQPAVVGYLPVSETCCINLKAGYHFSFGHSELNGVLVGVGISVMF